MSELFIGLMSGTSMDGIDAALINFTDAKPQLVASHYLKMPYDTRKSLIELSQPGFDEINRLGQLDRELGELFATTCMQLLINANISSTEVRAIGSHGQTIRHHPQAKFPFTLQIADPNTIAQKTGITTVADFRRRDIVVGGQGAPLTPLFHQWLFHSDEENRAVLNIGGISNISFLPKNSKQAYCGFDTGPGNTLIDAWIEEHLGHSYDHNGEWASSGKCNDDLLKLLLDDKFFQQLPPKSTGRERFNLEWVKQKIKLVNQTLNPEDIQATLLELTVCTICDAINRYCETTESVIVCGGGVHNHQLMKKLKQRLNTRQVYSTQKYDVDPNWLEAMAFAWFAKQTLNRNPLNFSNFTGAKQAVVLGAVYY